MKILLVSRYKTLYYNNILPFVFEQGEALAKQGVVVEHFLIKGSGMGAYFKNIAPLRKKIKELKPDIVHAHYGLSGVTSVMQGMVPTVITFHNGETLSKFVNFVTSVAAQKAAYSVIVAQHIYDKLIFKPKHYSIMPCGLNLNEMPIQDTSAMRKKLGFDDDTKYVLFGGAFDNLRKNYPLLKEAVSLIKDYKVEVLEMKGYNREQLNELMCACDVFCLPSKSEGSPQALKEAMACNCPIVATDIADVKHLLGNLEGHYLCDFNPENVASALNKAMQINARTRGRQRMLDLGLDNEYVAKHLIGIYESILK